MFWKDPFLKAPVRRYGPGHQERKSPPAWTWAILWFMTGVAVAHTLHLWLRF